MLATILIPAALCFAFGEAANVINQDALLCGQCHSFCGLRPSGSDVGGSSGNPHLLAAGADGSVSMEGKKHALACWPGNLFAVVTTASCGAVNAMRDSFTALGGMRNVADTKLAK